MKKAAPKQYFTLTEEVCVWAVILIISAVLFTTGYQNMKNDAKTSKCIANLTQIGQIWLLYAAENSDKAMPSTFYNGDSDRISFLTYLHNNYNLSADILVCPALTDETSFNPSDYDTEVRYMLTKGGYIMNTICDDAGAPDEYKGFYGWPYSSKSPWIKLSKVKDLSNKIVMTCAFACPETINSKSGWSSDMSSLRSWLETDHGDFPTTSGKDKRDVGNGHDGKFCALMGDGSVVVKETSEWHEWAVRKNKE